MKKIIRLLLVAYLLASANPLFSQSCYWVFLTDKAGSTFDPYSYFDAKAIERYRMNNADLFDISNYPLCQDYVNSVVALATEEVGQSRWLNAIGITATPEQIQQIEQLPFVREVKLLAGEMQTAETEESVLTEVSNPSDISNITDQLLRMRGDLFVKNGIDGKGLRIAVFDGGFHAVNTHQAFKHLRDNGQIVATWDFTKKREDVYDRHTHGTMVLSCIAGKLGDKQLGLATGATFLLAKTEVDPEPFKEEIWWMQAVEWADKNGADIINSSLGYTKDRHYTWEMDGRSYVSKAANIAARKGMLVCNSAGNSGSDENWKVIGAPADADSIISVGGIMSSLKSYQHISFSSYGPTADGRMKPNVCNFGHAECADPHDDTLTRFAYGTSFSSPLTAGFVACAWQTMRDKTAMQMKEQIERSADLYPYFDYALGYGVPQASYFIDNIQPNSVETFKIKDIGPYVLICPLANKSGRERNLLSTDNAALDRIGREDYVMLKLENHNGLIEQYLNLGIDNFSSSSCLAIPKKGIFGYTLVVNVNGNTQKYKLSQFDSLSLEDEEHVFEYHLIDADGYYLDNYRENGRRTLADNNVSKWGVNQKYFFELYLQYGMLWWIDNAPMQYSDALNFGTRFLLNLKKWYSLGIGLDLALDEIRYDKSVVNAWDHTLNINNNDFSNAYSKTLELGQINIELFQRIRLVSGGSFRKKGLHWDLGVYGGLMLNDYIIQFDENQNNGICNYQTTAYSGIDDVENLLLGVTTRLTWDFIGLYARYRLTPVKNNIPQLEFGIQFSL